MSHYETDDLMPLDGNAAAGALAEVFALEMTEAMVSCEGCGREGALATLRLYGRGAGLVLRCPNCETVNLRLLNTGTAINLDLRGCARLTFQIPRSDAAS